MTPSIVRKIFHFNKLLLAAVCLNNLANLAPLSLASSYHEQSSSDNKYLPGPPWVMLDPCGSTSLFEAILNMPPAYNCTNKRHGSLFGLYNKEGEFMPGKPSLRRQSSGFKLLDDVQQSLGLGDGERLQPSSGSILTKQSQSNQEQEDEEAPRSRSKPLKTVSMFSGETNDHIWINKEDIPSFVVVNIGSKSGRKFRCNGVLIHGDAVLTSASCIEQGEPLSFMSVILGIEDSIKFQIGYYCKSTKFSLNAKQNQTYDLAVMRIRGMKDPKFFDQNKLDVPCMDFKMKPRKNSICMAVTEGPRDPTGEISSYSRAKGLLIAQNCSKNISKKFANLGRACFERAHIDKRRNSRIANANRGSLCKHDYGAPIFCKSQCSYESPKIMLTGMFSFPIIKDDSEDDCKYTNYDRHPMIAMDFSQLGGEFMKLFNNCGLGYRLRFGQEDSNRTYPGRIYLDEKNSGS